MASIIINNLSVNGAGAANDIGAATGATTADKVKALIGLPDAELTQLENIVASGIDAIKDGSVYRRTSDLEVTQIENIIASGLDAIKDGINYPRINSLGSAVVKDIVATAGGTTGDKLASITSQATTSAKGTVAFASTGTQDATKVPKATAAEIASLLTAGGYSVAPASGLASLDNIADGSTYARVLSTIASGLNNGWYGALYDGIEWDENADTYTRIGRNSSSPNYLAIQNGMRRCILTASGEVAYYLYPTNSALKEDGVTASKLDGTDGQVMVEIPKFYYKYSYVGTKHSWKISELKLPGFDVHPLFMKDSIELSKAYVGAFEGVLYDTTISGYVSGNGVAAGAAVFASGDKSITCSGLTAPFENTTVGSKLVISGTVSNNKTVTVATVESVQKITVSETLTDETDASCTIEIDRDYTATTGDKLASVVGFAPITKITRAQARQLAKNMGANWSLLTFDMMSAIQLLYLIEYNSFYSQSKIGAGISNVSNWATYNNYYPLSKTGVSVALGNGTANTAGATSAATEVTKHLTYRGIENPFGHIWKWVDGFNINNNIVYVCNNSANFADDTASNYTTVGTMINANGYQNTLLATARGFLPKTVGSDSSHKITDYYYQAAGWRVATVGGLANYGAADGFFSCHCADASSRSSSSIGARLGFVK